MDLEELKRTWEALACRDPMWAVMTWDHKAFGGWDSEEFFATGVAEAGDWMSQLRGLQADSGSSHRTPFRSVLDFGGIEKSCG